jgi:hypothetical protein
MDAPSPVNVIRNEGGGTVSFVVDETPDSVDPSTRWITIANEDVIDVKVTANPGVVTSR